jgi:hypothetical protein
MVGDVQHDHALWLCHNLLLEDVPKAHTGLPRLESVSDREDDFDGHFLYR